MKLPLAFLLAAAALAAPPGACAQAVSGARPVTPDPSPEAAALLQFLQGISGTHILTGQHNQPDTHGRNSEFAAQYTGRTPIIFGSDWGFAKAGDKDSFLARPDIVQQAIREHEKGAIVALCWHAVPPTADEPITFQPLPGSDPSRLASVQGRLLDAQFRDILTPGTPLYAKWCAQVDTIAGYLRQLQDAHVPVLWRPYHEMNGDWFWWGARTGTYGTAALYRQIFDRLVNHHHLNNLVWVWSVDRPGTHSLAHDQVFPGINYVDVLALDVYRNDFQKGYYDSLVALSQGKPLALAEVGNPPSPEILREQPKWTYYMTWAGMVRNTSHRQYDTLFHDPTVLSLEDPAYWAASADYRRACGLPVLRIDPQPADFSGTWILNEDRSEFGPMGPGMSAVQLDIVQQAGSLGVRSTRLVEYEGPQVSEEHLPLDGTESASTFMNLKRLTKAVLSPGRDSVLIESTSDAPWVGAGAKMTTREAWHLQEGGRTLVIDRSAGSSPGRPAVVLYYQRK